MEEDDRGGSGDDDICAARGLGFANCLGVDVSNWEPEKEGGIKDYGWDKDIFE